MAVRWKFRSEANLKSFRLDGRRNVTVGELKSAILVSRKGLETMEIDIYNPNTEEKYYDDDTISRGENVEVRVRPLEGLARPSTTSESNAMSSSSSSSSSTTSFARPAAVPTFLTRSQDAANAATSTTSTTASTTATTTTTISSSGSSMADVLATRAAAAEEKRKQAKERSGSSAPQQPKKWVHSKRPKQYTKAQQEQYLQRQMQEQAQRKPKTKEVKGIPNRFLVKKVGDEMELNVRNIFFFIFFKADYILDIISSLFYMYRTTSLTHEISCIFFFKYYLLVGGW